ncbi:MAG TPA: uracil-DNA glycosylase [Thermoanaerobaculia bacterium]|nr:uracil-DNA glycosylase [Thermoanaerobaculia bacterium]
MSGGGLPPGLADLLGYLGDLGYGDLYLRRAPAARPAAEVPQREAATAPPASPARAATAPAPGDVPLSESAAALAALAAEAAVCTRCRLAQGRHLVVFGSGDPAADLMFIGEGPGAEEDRQGLPFVGPAGELLTKIIQAMDLTRDQVYIANVVKCRPPGNRDPQPEEVAACRGYLERQIDLVKPRVIVALGKTAAQALLGNESPVGRMRGQWFAARGVPTLVTYHPAALLRNPALKRPTWDDMQQVRDHLRGAT